MVHCVRKVFTSPNVLLKLPNVLISRFRPELESQGSLGSESDVPLRSSFSIDSSAVRRGLEKSSRGLVRLGQSLRLKNSPRGFGEDVGVPKKGRWLDPASTSLQNWNKFFVFTCLVAIFVDPFFYYLPVVDPKNCIRISTSLKRPVTVFRTTTDFFYIVHMALQFRTAYVRKASRATGQGELVTDLHRIAKRYLKRDFWLDFVAVLPVPQVYFSFYYL